MKKRRLGAGLAALFLSTSPALGHDLWLAPSSFQPEPGEGVRVDLVVGDTPATAGSVPRNAELLIRLSAFEDGAPESPLAGFDGQAPAGLWKPSAPGTAILAYEGRPRSLELPAERFEHYLLEEGLESIAAERARRGEAARAGRELYSRSVKALVQVGEGVPRDRPVGLPFELVIDGAVGRDLSARLLRRGVPVAGVLVEAVALEGEATKLPARSDAEGKVSFRLPRGGRWYLAAVFMERIEPATDAEWRSTWTSLAFELPAHE